MKFTPTDVYRYIEARARLGDWSAKTASGHRAAISRTLAAFPINAELDMDILGSVMEKSRELSMAEISDSTWIHYAKRTFHIVQAMFDKPVSGDDVKDEKFLRRLLTSARASNADQAREPEEIALRAADVDYPRPKELGIHRLTLPFPLRPDFLAEISVPVDLTHEEADRLCTFIKALGQGQRSLA